MGFEDMRDEIREASRLSCLAPLQIFLKYPLDRRTVKMIYYVPVRLKADFAI